MTVTVLLYNDLCQNQKLMLGNKHLACSSATLILSQIAKVTSNNSIIMFFWLHEIEVLVIRQFRQTAKCLNRPG